MSISKKYITPPFLEAICRFRFATHEGVSLFQVIDDFYQTIKSDFPKKSILTSRGLNVDIENFDEIGPLREDIELFKFYNETGNLIVQIGETVLTVNHLRPYSSWENYSTTVLSILKRFGSVFKFNLFAKVAIRYLNKIDISSDEFDLEDYFNLKLQVPHEMESTLMGGFDIRSNLWTEDRQNVYTLALKTAPGNNDKSYSFIFELGYFNADDGIKIDEIDNWFDNAHECLNKAFESTLTPKCKLIFDEGK
ncbi:TIGR04255 family protein [Chitinophaga sp. HK235]|uniref:TIGR04255 family protein n=1 Tax=Chitinophaga sp. HK235 TaxID=2952571 RepID=UPI001BAC752A|nr:TIGR04255 family protein [Chitinophaga sp. HK235]